MLTKKFDIRDAGLAEKGRSRIVWAEQDMRVLRLIRERFEKEQPLKGLIHGLDWETTGRMGSLAATCALEEYGTQNHQYELDEFISRFGQEFGDWFQIAKLEIGNKKLEV